MRDKKLVYIASPYAGDIENNIAFAKAACRYAIAQGKTPIAVHLLYPQILDDSNSIDRTFGLKLGLEVMERCDELWMCGDQTSAGMLEELEQAKNMSLPIRYLSRDQIMEKPDPVWYAIWAQGQTGGPLQGQAGFLYENKLKLTFSKPKEAEQKIKDLCSICVNGSPVVNYRCTENYGSNQRMHLEIIKQYDLNPAFDPNRYEIRTQGYGNTGGGCMVGTVAFYLPDLDKTVWVNCNEEGAAISSADCVWNEDHSNSFDRYEDVYLFSVEFDQDQPEKAGLWLPMIKEALAYTIKEELMYYQEFSLPVEWLPNTYRLTAGPDYLEWLQDRGERATIVRDGKIEIEENYLKIGPVQS